MNLSVTQCVVTVAAITAATVLACVGSVDSTIVVVGLFTLASNALGYVNGKKIAHRERQAELDVEEAANSTPPTPPVLFGKAPPNRQAPAPSRNPRRVGRGL